MATKRHKKNVIPAQAGIQKSLPRLRKIGPWAAFIFMLAALLYLIYLLHTTYASIPNLIRGNPFVHGFEYPAGPIKKWYAILTILTAIALPYTTLARCLSHRKTRLAYWFFLIPTAALYLYLLIAWTIPFSWLIQYINDMGSTPKRTEGILYGLGGYIAILVFLYWVTRKPKVSINPTG